MTSNRRRELQPVNYHMSEQVVQKTRSIWTFFWCFAFGQWKQQKRIENKDQKTNRHPRRVPEFWRTKLVVSSHLNHCFFHPCSISPLLRRAASHIAIRDTPKTTSTKKNQKNRRHKSNCFSFGVCGAVVSKNQIKTCSTVN